MNHKRRLIAPPFGVLLKSQAKDWPKTNRVRGDAARGPPMIKASQRKAWHSADRNAANRNQAKPLDWRKRMSDNIAYALLVYTGLQIFLTMGALQAHSGSLLPYFALIVLVAGIIPACRSFERRWNRLSDQQAADPALAGYYRRDRAWLWVLAISLPVALTGLFKLLAYTIV